MGKGKKTGARELVERYLSEEAFDPDHRRYLQTFLSGDDLTGEDADIALEVALDWRRRRLGRSNPDPAFDDETRRLLMTARLHADHALREGFLSRLGEDPAAALKYLEEWNNSLSRLNSLAASHDRASRQDKCTKLIGDCLDDNPSASLDEVWEYLREAPGVQEQEPNRRLMIDDEEVDRSRVRSKLRAARKKQEGAS
jgi:hypothetical protein